MLRCTAALAIFAVVNGFQLAMHGHANRGSLSKCPQVCGRQSPHGKAAGNIWDENPVAMTKARLAEKSVSVLIAFCVRSECEIIRHTLQEF